MTRVAAFAPGRANLIGEHTDYNAGLSLPFAIEQGVTVRGELGGGGELLVRALDHGEEASFALTGAPGERLGGWRDFVRGAIGELSAAGAKLRAGALSAEGDVPEGSGLSSSAAFEVALCLALAGEPRDRVALAKLCSRIENDWVGAHTGLLDQLSSLLGRAGHALLIDFRTLETRPVPLELGEWRLVTVDSREPHSLAASKYNERRAECERACEMLGIGTLREATMRDLDRLPDPLERRARHVLEENARVVETVTALHAGDLAAVGELLDGSHASLRDLYDASTEAVERTVDRVRAGGAAGARMMGGGFGGQIIALLPPGADPPEGAIEVAPADGARLL